jgi:hypothetical protein
MAIARLAISTSAGKSRWSMRVRLCLTAPCVARKAAIVRRATRRKCRRSANMSGACSRASAAPDERERQNRTMAGRAEAILQWVDVLALGAREVRERGEHDREDPVGAERPQVEQRRA